jgi:hypothetical protein
VLRVSPVVTPPSGASRTRTAPISMMRSRSGSKPVVSRSRATRSMACADLAAPWAEAAVLRQV